MASFEEYLQIQENLRKMVAPIQGLAIQSAALVPQVVDANSLASAWEPILERYLQVFSEAQSSLSDSLQESLSMLSHTMELATQNFFADMLDSVASSLKSAISSVDWYSTLDPVIPVLEEEFENEEDSVKEIPADIKARKPLTLDQLLALLSVILALVQTLISVQPNSQGEKLTQQQEILIEQGNTQIEQNSRIIELLEKQDSAEAQSELKGLVEDLMEVGNCVAEEIRSLTETEPVNKVKDPADVADDPAGDSEDVVEPAVDLPETNTDDETDNSNTP